MYLHFFELGIQGSKVGLHSCQLSFLLVQAGHELAVLPFSSRQLLLLWCHHLCNSAAQFQPLEMSHSSTQVVPHTGSKHFQEIIIALLFMHAFLHGSTAKVLSECCRRLLLVPLTLVMPCCQEGSDCLKLLFVRHCVVCEGTGGVKAQGTLLEYLS